MNAGEAGGLLARIEAYFDSAPRAAARAEDWYPFTLFVHEGEGWPYYARPAIGATRFSGRDVERVRQRQRALRVPEAFEWVAETTPGLATAARDAGLPVERHPLLALDPRARARPPLPAGTTVRLVTLDDDLALVDAVAHVGFGSPGTARGTAGGDALRQAARRRPAGWIEFIRARIRSGQTTMAIALVDGLPVSTGSHQPVGDVTEVVGVATLPAFRRRGLAGVVIDRLVENALSKGVETVFLSAGDDVIARVYERLGFRRVGTACGAEPEESG
jgi:GNAT superfamily N-acetyltransferase